MAVEFVGTCTTDCTAAYDLGHSGKNLLHPYGKVSASHMKQDDRHHFRASGQNLRDPCQRRENTHQTSGCHSMNLKQPHNQHRGQPQHVTFLRACMQLVQRSDDSPVHAQTVEITELACVLGPTICNGCSTKAIFAKNAENPRIQIYCRGLWLRLNWGLH